MPVGVWSGVLSVFLFVIIRSFEYGLRSAWTGAL